MIPIEWLYDANARIQPYINITPLTYDPDLNLYLKWENQQITRSFKVRGAINKVLSLQSWEIMQGLVTSSAGNHGLGVALAGRITNSVVTVFVPEDAPKNKIKSIQELGAIIKCIPGGYHHAENEALEYAKNTKSTWISPYNDVQVIAGQGTIGIEIIDTQPELIDATWIVPVGGGGLISGIGIFLNHQVNLSTEKIFTRKPNLIGVQSDASSFMYHYYYSGNQDGIIEFPSLADGLAGEVEHGSLTVPIIKKYVQSILLITEDDIINSIKYAWKKYNQYIEGSAATALAAVLTGKIKSKPAVIIVTGGNIDRELHYKITGGS